MKQDFLLRLRRAFLDTQDVALLRSGLSMTIPISETSTVGDAIARHPASITVLNAFGVDTCCGGSASIGEAAAHAHVETALLFSGLRALARDAGETVPEEVT